MAAISNFFKVTKNGDNYNMGISNAAELCKFFGDKTVYSLEHFIVGVLQTKVNSQKEKSPAKFARPKKGITKQAGEKMYRQPGWNWQLA